MRKDTVKIQPLYSSFLSCDKDTEAIIKTLFVDSKPYSDILKRLLVINKPDCLDTTNEDYKKMIDSKSLGQLIHEGYIRLNPKVGRTEFENIRSYILITFDSFTPNRINPEFRDCTVNFDIICYMDEWCLDDYKVRPLAIIGYIDGILNSLTNKNKLTVRSTGNNIRMSGYGAYKFLGCNLAVLNEDVSMYTLSYRAEHFTEDVEQIGEVPIS